MPFINVQGRKFYYEQRVSEGNSTLPLVFVHGFACSHEDWARQAEYFRSRHPVITCDLPGHGISDPSTDGGSIEACGAAVASLLNDLELPPAVLVGHSMGCRVVLQATVDAPQRVAKLILVDGSRVAESDPQKAEQQVRERIASVGYPSMIKALFSDMFVDGSDPDLKERLVRRALALPETIGSPLFARMVGWDAGKADAVLAQINVPTLVLQSTYLNESHVRVSLQPGEDTPWMRLVQDRVQNTELDIVGGVGHFSMLEAPDIVTQKIQAFINK